jgi:hypothetical protein
MTDAPAPSAAGRDGASRDAANCLATAAGQDGASLAASCHATAGRDGASLDGHLPGVEFHAARSSGDRSDGLADRGGAGSHRTAFRRAEVLRYAQARRRCLWPAHSCVHVNRGLSSHFAPLTPPALLSLLSHRNVVGARRHAQAVCNRACARADHLDCSGCARVLTGLNRRLVRLARTSSGRLAFSHHGSGPDGHHGHHGSGVGRASLWSPGGDEIQLEIRTYGRLCHDRPRRSASA